MSDWQRWASGLASEMCEKVPEQADALLDALLREKGYGPETVRYEVRDGAIVMCRLHEGMDPEHEFTIYVPRQGEGE